MKPEHNEHFFSSWKETCTGGLAAHLTPLGHRTVVSKEGPLQSCTTSNTGTRFHLTATEAEAHLRHPRLNAGSAKSPCEQEGTGTRQKGWQVNWPCKAGLHFYKLGMKGQAFYGKTGPSVTTLAGLCYWVTYSSSASKHVGVCDAPAPVTVRNGTHWRMFLGKWLQWTLDYIPLRATVSLLVETALALLCQENPLQSTNGLPKCPRLKAHNNTHRLVRQTLR